MPEFQFSFDTSVSLARTAARLYIWRRAGWRLVALFVATLCLLTVLLADGGQEWYLFLFLGIAFAKLVAWFSFYLRSGQYVDEMESKRVQVVISEDGIQMEDVDGGANLKWTAPISVLTSSRVWLFSYGKTKIYTYMPIEVLSEEIRSFIEKKAIEGGGKVS